MPKRPAVDLLAPDAPAQLNRAAKEVHQRRCRAIKAGITKDAMRVLEKVFRYDEDLFDTPAGADAQTLALRAAKRDGQLSVLRYIKRLQKEEETYD